MKTPLKRDQNRLALSLSRSPVEIREDILRKNYTAAMSGIATAIAKGEPWALNAYIRLATEPAQQQFIVHLHTRLGVENESELRALVEGGRKLSEIESMDREDRILACERYLAAEYAADPDRRRRSLLFSHAEVVDEVAEVPTSNGHMP